MLARWSTLRLQEGGLIAVIVLLGAVLTWFGGSVSVPVFAPDADGKPVQVVRIAADGTRTPVTVKRSQFLRIQNLAQLVKDASFVGVMAVGMTFVIIAGGIDLSVGALYALASVLAAMAMRALGPAGAGWPDAASVAVGIAVALAVGSGGGLANGLLAVGLRVHPFIITLGMMGICRGIAFVATRAMSIADQPPGLFRLVRLEVGGISLGPIIVVVAAVVVGTIVLSLRVFGRHVYAVGGNDVAARYSGIRVGRVRVAVATIAGLSAGVAALLQVGCFGAASSGDGTGYELNVIAAAVVGGASLSGGRGTALGAVLGAILIQMIDLGIPMLRIDQNYSQIIIGSVIILAVALDTATRALAARRRSA